MHDAMPTGIWLHNPLLSRQGNGHTRHALSIQFPARHQPSTGYCYPSCLHNAKLQRGFPASLHQWSRNASSCQPHHYWLAQGHQGSSSSPLPVLATIKDSLVLWGEALVIPPAKRERVLHQLHQFHQGITKSQFLACESFFWPGINKAIEEVVHQCETCTWFQSQNAVVPLTPTPTPSYPWQVCATNIFRLERVEYLVVGNFYPKMIFVWHLPPSHSNANKVVLLLKEMFADHGIPEVLHSDNGPQYESAQFDDFCISWGITHETSSLHYPQSNRFAEACIKSIKHALQWAKYSGANPQLALLALRAMPINTQASIPSRAVVPMPTQNNHSGQDLQQWPIIHTSLWADQHTLWRHQITSWQMQQNTCTTLCWSTSCNVWHPKKNLDSCYCDTCPTMEQLWSMHQQWFHILLHVETPSWMQCQSSQHCPKWHNYHTASSN